MKNISSYLLVVSTKYYKTIEIRKIKHAFTKRRDFATNSRTVPVFEDFPLDFAQLECPIQI